jgi:general secretion pathway protein G
MFMIFTQKATERQAMAQNTATGKNKRGGFTLIELLVVLAIIAMLAGIAAPVYFSSISKSREAALKQDLVNLRKALDDYYSANDKYPDDLNELVAGKYLRAIPKDPITDSNSSWVPVKDDDDDANGISDIKSGADGKSSDGDNYQDW